MKYETQIGRIALGCLLLCLVVSMLGCHGLRSRYGLVLREDMSAELWKFPNKANPVILAKKSDQNQQASYETETKQTAFLEPSGPLSTDAEDSCSETACTTIGSDGCLCHRPLLCMGGLGRGYVAEAASAAPPPAITPRFFPVPTRPVFTPRGDLSNLNPYAQSMVPYSPSGLPIPCEMSSETILTEPDVPQTIIPVPAPEKSLPQPQSKILPGPAPAPTKTSGSDAPAPSLLPSPQSHWAFVPQVPQAQEQNKARELIAGGTQQVK